MLPLVGSTMVPPGLSRPVALGGLDHAQGDAVFDRAAGVEVLDLGEHRARHARVLDDGAELDEGGVADEVGDVLCILHRAILGASETPHRSHRRSGGPPAGTLVGPAAGHCRSGHGRRCRALRW